MIFPFYVSKETSNSPTIHLFMIEQSFSIIRTLLFLLCRADFFLEKRQTAKTMNIFSVLELNQERARKSGTFVFQAPFLLMQIF